MRGGRYEVGSQATGMRRTSFTPLSVCTDRAAGQNSIARFASTGPCFETWRGAAGGEHFSVEGGLVWRVHSNCTTWDIFRTHVAAEGSEEFLQ